MFLIHLMVMRCLSEALVRILEADTTFERQFLLSNLGATVNVNELGGLFLLISIVIQMPGSSVLKAKKSLESFFSFSFQGISLRLLEMEIFTLPM